MSKWEAKEGLEVGGMLIVFKAEPRTVGVYPLILRLGGDRGLRALIYIAKRRERVLGRILSVFGIIPSCSVTVVGGKRSLASIAATVLAKVERVLEGRGPSVILIRKSASATFTTSLTTFCRRVPMKRIRTKLHACGVGSPCPRRFGERTVKLATDLRFTPARGTTSTLLGRNGGPRRVFVAKGAKVSTLRCAIQGSFCRPRAR